MKKGSIALVLLMAVMLVVAIACSSSGNGGVGGRPYNLDDYYLDGSQSNGLFLSLSWDCEKGGYDNIMVYDENGYAIGHAYDSVWDQSDIYRTDGFKTCHITKRANCIPTVGSRLELIITANGKEYNHTIYPQVRSDTTTPAPTQTSDTDVLWELWSEITKEIDATESELEAIEEDYAIYQEDLVLWSVIIKEIDEAIPGTGLSLKSITQSGSSITLQGSANEDSYIWNYATNLEEKEYFWDVTPTPISVGTSNSFTITMKYDNGGGQ